MRCAGRRNGPSEAYLPLAGADSGHRGVDAHQSSFEVGSLTFRDVVGNEHRPFAEPYELAGYQRRVVLKLEEPQSHFVGTRLL